MRFSNTAHKNFESFKNTNSIDGQANFLIFGFFDFQAPV